MNFNSNPILYPKKDELTPTKDNVLNPPRYPKEDGLNPQCYPKEDGLNPQCYPKDNVLNPPYYPKDNVLNPQCYPKDNVLNPPYYPKEDGLNPFKAIVERINALESVTRNYGDSFETKELTVSKNAQIENLNATEGTVNTLNSTNCNIENAQIENLRTNRLTWDLPSIDVENAKVENLNVTTEGTVNTLNSTNATVTNLNSTTSTVTNSNVKNAEVENLNVTTEIKIENLKTEEPILSNAVVGYDENGKIIPIKIAELDEKVDKVEGKGLSTNDFTDAYKNKLNNAVIDYDSLLNFIYPVGSLYWSSKSTNPSTLFGGTWVQIKDRFVLACGDIYTSVDATGGASTVTLSVDNMPSHSHSFTPSGNVSSSGSLYSGLRDGWGTDCLALGRSEGNITVVGGYNETSSKGYVSKNTAGKNFVSISSSFTGYGGTTSLEGRGTSFSILPPYVIKYCWERTA